MKVAYAPDAVDTSGTVGPLLAALPFGSLGECLSARAAGSIVCALKDGDERTVVFALAIKTASGGKVALHLASDPARARKIAAALILCANEIDAGAGVN